MLNESEIDIVWLSPNASDEMKQRTKKLCEEAGKTLVFEYNSIILSDPEMILIITPRKEENNLQTLSLKDAKDV